MTLNMRVPNKLQYVRSSVNAAAGSRLLRVRLFHPRGRYVQGRKTQPGALYWGDDDIVFSAVGSETWDRAADDVPFYSEMDWLSLDEIRLIGSASAPNPIARATSDRRLSSRAVHAPR